MEQKHGREASTALANIPKQGQLTQPQAEHILSLVYPGVPREEIIRCAILCRDFGLHPLMKEVYIIPFEIKGGGKNWVTVLGIQATRKIMAQRGTYSYKDDTPRLMTEEEQKRIFGEVDAKNIVAITKLRTKDGLEAPGYGKWPMDKTPYGTDKGNTKANMAFIRSERNAFGRLSPDALPPNVEIIDEAYVDSPAISRVVLDTGEIIEGEARELEPEAEKDDGPIVFKDDPPPGPDEGRQSNIDLDWMRESIKTLQDRGEKAYSDENMLSYMNMSYKVEGTDIYDIASKLDKGSANHLWKLLQEALEKK